MKVRVKYNKTHKFLVTLTDPNPTLANLRQEIRRVVESQYKESVREPLDVSLNGTDPLTGSDSNSLQSLGVVPGDLLTVLTLPTTGEAKATVESKAPDKPIDLTQQSKATSSKPSSVDNKSKTKQAGSERMEERPRLLVEARDGEAPTWLKEKMSECKPASVSQAINLLLHFTMTECGFQCEGGGIGPPSGWQDRVATFHYNSRAFPDMKCDLVLMTKTGVKQIIACFPEQEDELDITVNVVMKDYIKDTTQTPITCEDLVNVSQFAKTLKDRLLHPLQVSAHQLLGIPAPWHLAGLPDELLIKIVSLMDYRDVLALRGTCHRLHSLVDDNRLWMSLYKRDFGHLYDDVKDKTDNQKWKVKYREAVRRRKEWNQLKDDGATFVHPWEMYPGMPLPRGGVNPYPPQPSYPGMPRPRGDNPYPIQPHPVPNPFADPDSPYFQGDIPPMPGAFPEMPDPLGPLGPLGPFRPSPSNPFQPRFMPPRPRNPRGPRFDFF
ncbi:hypothetical protein Pcinc_027868 [Petrolisthes cinctipes]|uniref:F-box domain-containing protein n=1 Tax=Petrolisthes cinctipes TaxID=88211 RepID=A0AAE1F412_PETCI|nr:hypothetical protein Pcinc_027868 [Petrolisthes cinctipes]